MKKLKLIFIVIAFAILYFSCGKGSAGPKGPAGPTGPVGSANVIYSAWFLTGAGWDTVTNAPSYGAYATYDKAATGITQSIIDNGVVLVYMKGDPTTGLANDVFPLPYSIGAGYGFTDLWDFVLNAPGNIRFLYKSDFPWDVVTLGGISFRYVIIPGGVAGGRMLNLRKMTYEEVCKLYGIPE
ncbi:MAG TPA: hypothetical protein VGI82_00960 [Chitinophagaceae bacterium]